MVVDYLFSMGVVTMTFAMDQDLDFLVLYAELCKPS